jgi:hypothetical protein
MDMIFAFHRHIFVVIVTFKCPAWDEHAIEIVTAWWSELGHLSCASREDTEGFFYGGLEIGKITELSGRRDGVGREKMREDFGNKGIIDARIGDAEKKTGT